MRIIITILRLSIYLSGLALPIQEAAKTAASRLVKRFRQFDRNGDGKLSPEELPSALFNQLDSNNDGFVTLQEVRAFFAGRRIAQPDLREREATLPETAELRVVDAVFELCVCDLEACVKFYRDGIGMREAEPSTANNALLEWAGCYLRLCKVSGEKIVSTPGNPIKQILSSKGFRWLSLWVNDLEAISNQLVKAGFPAPLKARRVIMTQDPEGNIIEIMNVPGRASGETLTVGMIVSDEKATHKFYRETLGLQEFDQWNAEALSNIKMYLYAIGSGIIKILSPPGKRPVDAEAGPEAPGHRSMTWRVADLSSARRVLQKRGMEVEGDEHLTLTDPDGNRIYIEQAPPKAIKMAAARKVEAITPAAQKPSSIGRIQQPYGNIKPRPHQEEIAEQRPSEPPLKKMPDGDPARDAAGRGQLFESICVPGFTDIQEGMNGLAIVDLNKDGWLDIVATYSPPRNWGGAWSAGEKLRVFINVGDFNFIEHRIILLSSKISPESFGRGQVPNLADFNGDGFLGLFLTRHAQMAGSQSYRNGQKIGNGLACEARLKLSAEKKTFEPIGKAPGLPYISLADVDNDGLMDVLAVGPADTG